MAIDNLRTKILLSAYACEPGKGSEPGVGWNWALHLAKKYEVYVITRENNKSVIERYIRENKIENIHFYYYDCADVWKKIKKLPNGIFLYYKIWQNGIIDIARDIVKKEDIDIIHHITFNEFRTPGKLYKLDVPFVWGPIGGGQFYSSKFRKAYFRLSDIFKEITRNLINICSLKFSCDIHNVVKKADAILIADQSTEKIMPKSRHYYRLLETAYNIDRNQTKTYDENRHFKNIRLLWVGGIWPRKGLKVLIDALGRSDFRNFELTIVGSGSDKTQCEKLIKKYGIEKLVSFKGNLSYEAVNAYYDRADVFVFTSLRDTSGNVVLEAMSHGLPVIAFNHHGVGEIVTNDTGRLIEIGEYNIMCNNITEAIKDYYENYDKIVLQGMKARKRIEDKYTWKYSVDYISKIYDEILGE